MTGNFPKLILDQITDLGRENTKQDKSQKASPRPVIFKLQKIEDKHELKENRIFKCSVFQYMNMTYVYIKSQCFLKLWKKTFTSSNRYVTRYLMVSVHICPPPVLFCFVFFEKFYLELGIYIIFIIFYTYSFNFLNSCNVIFCSICYQSFVLFCFVSVMFLWEFVHFFC